MKVYRIGRGISKRMHRYFAYQVTKHSESKEIKSWIKAIGARDLTKQQKSEIKEYYKSFGFNKINLDWHVYYTALTGRFSKEYIPIDFFYNVVEPSLNPRIMFPSLTDKNLLEGLFSGFHQPRTVVKNINGRFSAGKSGIISLNEVIDRCREHDRLIIKPSIDTGGGRNVKLINLKSGTEKKSDYLRSVLEEYNKDFIIQEYFQQHDELSKLNQSSVNTLRIKSLIVENEIKILSCVVRVGSPGSLIDNMSSGGYILKVNEKGALSSMGYYSKPGKTVEQTADGRSFKDIIIPNYDLIMDFVRDLHFQALHFGMISWDIALDLNGNPILIEYNTFGQGIGQEYGTPFNAYTDYVLAKCKLKLFSF